MMWALNFITKKTLKMPSANWTFLKIYNFLGFQFLLCTVCRKFVESTLHIINRLSHSTVSCTINRIEMSNVNIQRIASLPRKLSGVFNAALKYATNTCGL